MPPERCGGKRATHSDVYSLACTWYYLLIGRTPFGSSADENEQRVMQRHMTAVFPNSPLCAGSLLDAAGRVLHRPAEKDPEKRYQNCVQMLAAMEELLTEGNTAVSIRIFFLRRGRR